MNLKELLYEKGYKYTIQREEILDVLMEKSSEHLRAEDIYELVKVKDPDIGLSTVYRTLLIFNELHIINRLGLDHEFRYELNTSDIAHEHHHLICIKCGRIIDVKESFMNEMSEQISSIYNFTAKGYDQKLYGICKDCLMGEV